MEHRNQKGTVEVRAREDGTPVIAGYAAVFNRDSADMGFIEQVDPRAFDKTIREADVRGLGNHDVNWLLGRSKASTLRLFVDSVGLGYEIDVNEKDPDGVRALEKVRRGDWDGSSFSFTTIRDEWNWEAQPPQRRLLEVALVDVGPVTFPAYPDATSAARSALAPIAKRTGHQIDDLVTALSTGEIRSLLEPAPEITVTAGEEEQRVGKKLSAKSLEQITTAMKALRDLLDQAKDEAAGDWADEEENSLRSAIDALTEVRSTLEAELPAEQNDDDGFEPRALLAMRERELSVLRDAA